MTEIDELLWKINKTPSFLAEVDWKEETSWFDKGRIKQIIMGIERDDVCDAVEEYIILNWYTTELEEDKGSNNYLKLCDLNDCNYYQLRFKPEEPNSWHNYLPKIENFILEVKEERNRKNERKNRLKQLNNRIKQLDSKYSKESAGIEPFVKNDLFLNQLYYDYQKLKEENEELRNRLDNNNSKNREQNIRFINNEIRCLLENIISYAEKFPSNQNEKAEVIKEVLMSKYCYGYIKKTTLTDDLMHRLTNLGRKEPPGLHINTLHTEKVIDVHGNENVKL